MREYRKLNKQPLKFVLAEFRFSPVLRIDDYIPKFQDVIRKQYPILNNKTEQIVQVNSGGIDVSTINRWSFISVDKRNAIELDQEKLIYCTADYPRFSDFADACQQLLNTLAEIVVPSLILRIGLRYSDLIRVAENETITELVDAHFAFPSHVSDFGQGARQQSETLITTEHGHLAIRTLYGHHHLSCLQDLNSLPITIEQTDDVSERMILDIDHFWKAQEQSIRFDVDQILNKISKLHETSRKAFWRMTTDYARNEKWA